jgi:hypothetical protein
MNDISSSKEQQQKDNLCQEAYGKDQTAVAHYAGTLPVSIFINSAVRSKKVNRHDLAEHQQIPVNQLEIGTDAGTGRVLNSGTDVGTGRVLNSKLFLLMKRLSAQQ